MKGRLKDIVKYIRPLYWIYNKVGNVGIAILKLFVHTDDKLILFISFGGKKYDDSPRVIYEAARKDKRFRGYKFVWAFNNPEDYAQIENRIKVDTLKYYITALAARVWVTNSTVERGLNFKGKNTFYFDTWHGSPIKKMGSDIASNNKSFKLLGEWLVDVMTAQSDYEAEIFSRVFNINRERFLMCGLPRNDELANYSKQKRDEYRKKIGIPDGKKAILYMPTFREFEKSAGKECVFIPPIDLDKWEKRLGDEYVFLFRAHYEVARAMSIKNNVFVQDVTFYPVLDELMIASDILISDYSSVYFDYSIMNKPMLHYTYDYDLYNANRGMYFDIRSELDGAAQEDQLIDIIKNMDYSYQIRKLEHFRNKYLNYFGTATKKSLDCIYENLQKL